ncbi:MAG: hypothetical protein OEU49_07785, partial [Chromatiales bacterium]|nr:hypothetical protein [Chromatiales bacterium]
AYWRGRVTANDRHAMLRFGRGILERAGVSDQLERIARGIPDAQLEVIPRAGHVCTVEQPDAVNEVLVRFLERQRRRAGQPRTDSD